jgi:hypothetical protein
VPACLRAPDVTRTPSMEARLRPLCADTSRRTISSRPSGASKTPSTAAWSSPVRTSSAEARQLTALAAERGRLLSVFHNRRWDSDFLTVRRCLETGLLGDVSSFVSRYDRFRPVPKGSWKEEDVPGSGVLWDLGPHLIDQAVNLFGPVQILTMSIWSGLFLGSVVLLWLTDPFGSAAIVGNQPWVLGVLYLLAMAPAGLYASRYRRRTPDLSRLRALVLAHVFVIYGYLWFLSGWRAVWQATTRQRGWAKTARTPQLTPGRSDAAESLLDVARSS